MYAYQQGGLLDLHTGPHQGHFLATVRENQRISIEVDEPGALERGKPLACNSALAYNSVIAYGRMRIVDEPTVNEKKVWSF
jgi:nitroimidazol reductase NimA-like FMN-containing flavoprotein (pyridoxamine 5'-phosphate oxidase superfamily)